MRLDKGANAPLLILNPPIMNNYDEQDRANIGDILQTLAGDEIERPTNSNGGLDIAKFNEQDKVKEVVSKLKEIGVRSSKDLMSNGFIPAGMILKID